MPMSNQYKNRLYPVLNRIAKHFGTPFHIYDEAGIRATGQTLINAFAKFKTFREYFAVKALPNPRILKIMKGMGFGFDCSSIAELVLSRQAGAHGKDIMFTSNNTSREEFLAVDGGILVKEGETVSVATLMAVKGDLGILRKTVETFIGEQDERERKTRSAVARLEADFIRRFVEFGKNA